MLQHQETQGPSRNIKEAMFICVNDPSLNRNLGKYQLPHIWDNILQDTPALQVKQSNLPPSLPLTGTTPRFPNLPLMPCNQSKVGANVHSVVCIQMGGAKAPPTSSHPLPMFPHSSLYSSTIKVSLLIILCSLTFLSDLMKWS